MRNKIGNFAYGVFSLGKAQSIQNDGLQHCVKLQEWKETWCVPIWSLHVRGMILLLQLLKVTSL